MNLYHLRYFVTLAHLEHYTNAARKLDITQPSLSHAICAIEEELGVKLFERNGRNVSLTKYGRMFLTDTEDILERLDASIHKMQLASKGNDTLDLSFLRTLGVSYIPGLLDSFLYSNSDKNIQYHLHCDRVLSADVISDLKEKKCDIAFCSKIKDEPNIEFVPVCQEELVVIVPLEHPLADRESVSLSKTMNYKHILFRKKSGLYNIIRNLFIDNIGKMPEIACEVEEDQVAAGLVANHFGIAIVPSMPLLEELPIKTLKLTDPDYTRLFYMCYLKNTYHPPIVDDFIRFTKEYSKDIPSVLDGTLSAPKR